MKLFRWIKCTWVKDAWYLDQQLGMKCLESEWWFYFWVAFVCFWIYVVGIPVVLLIVLWKRKYSPAGKFNKKGDKRLISDRKGLGWLVCKCVPKRLASYFEPDPEHDLDHIHTKREFGPLYLNYEPEPVNEITFPQCAHGAQLCILGSHYRVLLCLYIAGIGTGRP